MHDPVTCPDCVKVTRGQAIAIRQCPAGRAATDAKLDAARAANPEVAAIHRMLAAAGRA